MGIASEYLFVRPKVNALANDFARKDFIFPPHTALTLVLVYYVFMLAMGALYLSGLRFPAQVSGAH